MVISNVKCEEATLTYENKIDGTCLTVVHLSTVVLVMKSKVPYYLDEFIRV